MKRFIFVLLAVPALAYAATCALKVWNANDAIKAADLNSNMSCINTATPAGTPIVDAVVSSSAAINRSKLDIPALVPKAWAYVGFCNANGACSINANSRISAVSRTGQGIYNVTMTVNPPNTNLLVLAGQNAASGSNGFCGVSNVSAAAPNFIVNCNTATAAPVDPAGGFYFIVMDDDNY